MRGAVAVMGLSLALVPPPGAWAGAGAPARLVTVGGPVTETVFALGFGERVVGVDTSSVHPEATASLPKVGYQRTLSAEGVLSLDPDLVLADAEAGPPPAIEQLRAAGVSFVSVPGEATLEGAKVRIRRIAEALGAPERGEALVRELEEDLSAPGGAAARNGAATKVLFVYARGGGTLLVAGADTSADTMIRLAGGRNAVTGYEGFKPLTAEAAVAAAPDVILVTTRGLGSLGGPDALFSLPGLAATPAGRDRRVVAMDDLLLLGFGPRTGKAVAELAGRLRSARAGDGRRAGDAR